MLKRAPTAKCEFILGIPRSTGGTEMVYCESVPVNAFAVNGLSPLFLCSKCTGRMRKMLIAFVDDMEIHKLSR